jgi:hypothetical protein
VQRSGSAGTKTVGSLAVDSEGNEVGAVSPWDDWYANDLYDGKTSAVLVCGTCGEVIEEVDLSS